MGNCALNHQQELCEDIVNIWYNHPALTVNIAKHGQQQSMMQFQRGNGEQKNKKNRHGQILNC